MQKLLSKTPRAASLEAIKNLSENADYDEIMYKLYVLSKISKGIRQHEEGKTISHEDVKNRFANENNMV
jgi:predicted transcriptional regulator